MKVEYISLTILPVAPPIFSPSLGSIVIPLNQTSATIFNIPATSDP
jgi:hypothetical protein